MTSFSPARRCWRIERSSVSANDLAVTAEPGAGPGSLTNVCGAERGLQQHQRHALAAQLDVHAGMVGLDHARVLHRRLVGHDARKHRSCNAKIRSRQATHAVPRINAGGPRRHEFVIDSVLPLPPSIHKRLGSADRKEAVVRKSTLDLQSTGTGHKLK